MNRKRIWALVFVLALSLGSVALGEGAKPTLGIIDITGADDVMEHFYPGVYNIMLFPTMNEVLIALKSGRVDVAWNSEDYAAFLMQADDTVRFEQDILPASPLSMLTRASDTELTAALSEAIAALREDGTLDALRETYIVGVSPDTVPEVAAAAQIDGAQTVVVGVSGDFPPQDFVSVSGAPAGFNVALMNEIAALAGLNIKYETVAFGAKFAALESGRIDLFFLHAGYTSFYGIAQTEAYADDVHTGFLSLK